MNDHDKYPAVKVIWYDAASYDEWTTIEELDLEPKKIITYGIMIDENETYIQIAQNIDEEQEQVCMVMVIPALWVENIFYLTLEDEENPHSVVHKMAKPKKLHS